MYCDFVLILNKTYTTKLQQVYEGSIRSIYTLIS